MSGSIEKAKVSLTEIRKQIDDAEFLGDTSAAKVQALTAIVGGLCDVITMLVCEAVEVEK